MTPAEALAALRLAEREDGAPGLQDRRDLLEALRAALIARAEDIAAAADADFGGRSREETLLADVLLVADAARFSGKRLRRWARGRRAPVPFPFLPSRAWVEHVPKGVVGIMAPWNYPVQLSLGPAVDAIAAGNRVCIKPSEATPRLAALIGEVVERALGPRMGRVVTGGPAIAAEFAAQPWDHLMFTGGTGIGRKVMEAAARNLVPVTLELGGKCPAIVLPGADLPKAARAILAAKAVNAGQTCVAPDTVLLVGHGFAAFADACRATGIGASETAVINPVQRARLDRLLGDARLTPLGEGRTPLCLAPSRGALAEEEIFGPVLAVEECADLSAALRWVAARPHPLAVSLFGPTRAEEAAVAARVKCGAITVDRALDHAAFYGMGFGGVGLSGFGRRAGEAGFREFSNPRARVRHGPFALSRLLDPPRGDFARRLARRLIPKR